MDFCTRALTLDPSRFLEYILSRKEKCDALPLLTIVRDHVEDAMWAHREQFGSASKKLYTDYQDEFIDLVAKYIDSSDEVVQTLALEALDTLLPLYLNEELEKKVTPLLLKAGLHAPGKPWKYADILGKRLAGLKDVDLSCLSFWGEWACNLWLSLAPKRAPWERIDYLLAAYESPKPNLPPEVVQQEINSAIYHVLDSYIHAGMRKRSWGESSELIARSFERLLPIIDQTALTLLLRAVESVEDLLPPGRPSLLSLGTAKAELESLQLAGEAFWTAFEDELDRAMNVTR